MAASLQLKRRTTGAVGSPAAAGALAGEVAINFAVTPPELWAFDGAAWQRANPIAGVQWLEVGVGNVNLARNSRVSIGQASDPVAQIDLNGAAVQNAVAMPAGDMDLALGQVFSRTIAANTTFSFSNVPGGRAVTVVLHLTNAGSRTNTWPASVKWAGGAAPTLTAAGVDILVFFTDTGGTLWHGNLYSKDSK
jgi:hypothetical protein